MSYELRASQFNIPYLLLIIQNGQEKYRTYRCSRTFGKCLWPSSGGNHMEE